MQFITSRENGVKLITLTEDGESLMTVAPGYGAKLKNLKLKKGNQYHEVLWPVSTEDLKSNSWYKSAILFPYPNRLEAGRYSFENKKYQFPINEPDKNNQLHGMLYNEPFNVAEQNVEGTTASIELTYRYEGTASYFPFPFIFSVKYTYGLTGFAVDFKVINSGSGNLPFGLGWHPYFQIDGQRITGYSLQTPPLTLIELSERAIPTGAKVAFEQNPIRFSDTRLDNAFAINESANVYDLQDEKTGVTLRFTGSEAFDYIQMFTPNEETVAIEPMTCNVNAFNNGEGVKTLGPQEIFKAKFQIAIA